MNLNCLQIDTKTRGLRFNTTPRSAAWQENTQETRRQTTRTFIRESQNTGRHLVAAINADAFSPWPAPYNEETPTNLLGLAVSDGTLVSPGSGEPSFMVDKDGSVSIAATTPATDITSVRTAVSGFGFVLEDGMALAGDKSIHPRTGIGISKDKRFVYFLTIDGRQLTSYGATTQEVGQWLKHFGAYTGINMDGGGSTTMVWWDPKAPGADKTALLNVPVGNGLMLGAGERCNGNNIGIYYEHKPGGNGVKKALPWALALGLALLVR